MKRITYYLSFVVILAALLAACAPAEPETVVVTQVVQEEVTVKETVVETVIETVIVEVEAEAQPEPTDTLSLAKKEGEVVWYTTMPSSGREPLAELWAEKYPEIELKMFQAGSLDIVGRYQAEVSAGAVLVDAIHITDMVFFLDQLDAGNLMEYHSPEFEAYEGLPEGWVYPGYIAPLRVMPIGALVNTDAIDWESVQSYEDLLSEEYAGVIAGGDVAGSTRAYLNYYAHQPYARDWYEKLNELEPQYYESSEAAMNNLLSGEWLVLFEAWIYKDYEFRVLKGAPVHAVFPEEGIAVVVAPNTIMAQAPHPNAAKVFQDFLYSQEAQALLVQSIGVHSARADVPAPEGLPTIGEMNVVGIDFRDAQAQREALIEDWRELTGR